MIRINQYLARLHPDISRRKADELVRAGKVHINDVVAVVGQQIGPNDRITVEGYKLEPTSARTILFHKPADYIVSRNRQGSVPTIYTLLPRDLRHLQPVGRLDKESRGLLLLSNDGELIQQLTHPRYEKMKVYHVTLSRPLTLHDLTIVNEGVYLDDGLSRLGTSVLRYQTYEVRLHEGRNRQIRRTFDTLGYEVTDLLRVRFGDYELGELKEGNYRET